MQEDIAFDAEETTRRGWLYLPDGANPSAPWPIGVMAHGYSAVKEQ